MKVLRAANAGFCMGVSLALQKLEKALSHGLSPAHSRICTLGPIIHNPQVLAAFEAQGVVCLNDTTQAASNDYILIRAHGIPLNEEQRLKESCLHVEDATCPKVKKAQLSIARATQEGASLLLFGDESHPEVQGLVSYACGAARVFGSLTELEKLPLNSHDHYVLASQTTQDREMFDAITKRLKSSLKNLNILTTICDATHQRQEEALNLAAQSDVMVVVGGRQSGNTRRLASITQQAGIETWHIENVNELDAAKFRNKSCAGLTAGASTPKSIIDEVEQWLLSL